MLNNIKLITNETLTNDIIVERALWIDNYIKNFLKSTGKTIEEVELIESIYRVGHITTIRYRLEYRTDYYVNLSGEKKKMS